MFLQTNKKLPIRVLSFVASQSHITKAYCWFSLILHNLAFQKHTFSLVSCSRVIKAEILKLGEPFEIYFVIGCSCKFFRCFLIAIISLSTAIIWVFFYNSKNLNCIGALSFSLRSVYTFSWFLKSNWRSDFGHAKTGSGAKERMVLRREMFSL